MKRILPFLLLAVATLAVYSPALRNGFVWDDTALILRDPLIRSWRLIPEGFQHFLFTDATASAFYRPLQRLSYTLEYAAFGFRAGPYHATNVVLHLLAACALFIFARELLRNSLVALIAALIWSIHPLHTSAVAYISGRADCLAAVFGFSGLYLGLRSTRAAGARSFALNVGAALALLLSALSKESGLIFLPAWLVILFLRSERKRALHAGVAIAFVLVIYGSLRFGAEHVAPPPLRAQPALVRPILVARAFAEYTWLIFFPLQLHMERDVETHPFGFSSESMTTAAWRELQTLAGILLMAAFIYWLVRERKRDSVAFLCLLLTVLSYLPVSGIFSLNATIAEHWLYLPAAFLFLAAIHTAARLRQRRTLIIALAAGWIVFLGARTFLRASDWKDQRTFLERTLAAGGDSARMRINLGRLELSEGRLMEARRNLEAALKKEPDQPFAVINLAAVALKENDFKTSHELLARAQTMPLVEAQAHEMLALLEQLETGRPNLLRMRLASRTGPPNWSIEKRYLRLLDETGATEKAIAELQHCLQTQWYRADSWQLLSELLGKAGRTEEATHAAAQADRYDVRLNERR